MGKKLLYYKICYYLYPGLKNNCFEILYCRYLALESMCLLATSEFSHEAVKKHQETVITALKVLNSEINSSSSLRAYYIS